MDDNQRLHLQKMIAVNNVEDQTGLIRELKHSHILRENVNNLVMLKAKHMDDHDALNLEAMTAARIAIDIPFPAKGVISPAVSPTIKIFL